MLFYSLYQTMRLFLLLGVMGFLFSGCQMIEEFGGQPEMTSPCVGADDSPCGPKRPVNKWLFGANAKEFA